ncbi:hypothetical protein ACFCX4_00145 [Kitasatospora sp. NPDC056327]|uniref:hypothetical protein n=1 Tax=Kitasatospora sp. NPDC056327 TaxID=3345785 RepID=UPI0035D97D52
MTEAAGDVAMFVLSLCVGPQVAQGGHVPRSVAGAPGRPVRGRPVGMTHAPTVIHSAGNNHLGRGGPDFPYRRTVIAGAQVGKMRQFTRMASEIAAAPSACDGERKINQEVRPMNTRKQVVACALSLIIGAGVLAFASPAASADETNCKAIKITGEREGGYSECATYESLKKQRVKIVCRNISDPDYLRYGEWEWMKPGVRSYAYCEPGDEVVAVGVDTA